MWAAFSCTDTQSATSSKRLAWRTARTNDDDGADDEDEEAVPASGDSSGGMMMLDLLGQIIAQPISIPVQPMVVVAGAPSFFFLRQNSLLFEQ